MITAPAITRHVVLKQFMYDGVQLHVGEVIDTEKMRRVRQLIDQRRLMETSDAAPVLTSVDGRMFINQAYLDWYNSQVTTTTETPVDEPTTEPEQGDENEDDEDRTAKLAAKREARKAATKARLARKKAAAASKEG